MKLDITTGGGQIKSLSSDQILSFRFTEVMKDNFQISDGDPLEFSIAINPNNGVCLCKNSCFFLHRLLPSLGFTTCYSN